MTEKKVSVTDPTFPAPPANAPAGPAQSAEPAPAPAGGEPIDEILDSFGKPPPDRVYQPPKNPPARAEHHTEPDEAVIVRQPTQPGLGDGLNVTPEERARLDAMMKAHAQRNAKEGNYLAPGDRQADTDPRHLENKPPPVTTETGRALPRKSFWPAAIAVLAVALAIVFLIARASSRSPSSSPAASTAAVAATTPTNPTVADTTPTPPLPTIPTTNVESLPTVADTTARPAPTARPVHSATTAQSGLPVHTAATATAAATSNQPPPPGMNLLPDDPHK